MTTHRISLRLGTKTQIKKLLPSLQKLQTYSSTGTNSRIILKDESGRSVGVIQLSGLDDDAACVIWRDRRLVGQCRYKPQNGWLIYPIEKGFLAPEPLTQTDPVQYLITLDENARQELGASKVSRGE
jgi:hypothetical protein